MTFDIAAMSIGFSLSVIGLIGFFEHISAPSEPDKVLDCDWFRDHERDLWESMTRVSDDAARGRYQ